MNNRFEIIATSLVGLHVLQRKPAHDSRGLFERMFCFEELELLLKGRRIMQINHSITKTRGTVRGLHFQHYPHAEIKIVSCLRGEVFDVAVDLTEGSPTFLHWHGEVLSAVNYKTLFIPEGFAHGFQTLSDDCELLYLHTAAYCREAEAGFHVEDERLTIHWPLLVEGLSPRDAALPRLAHNFRGIALS